MNGQEVCFDSLEDGISGNGFYYCEAVEYGYLLKNYETETYLAVKDGILVASELVEGDTDFVFNFAVIEDHVVEDDEYYVVANIVGNAPYYESESDPEIESASICWHPIPRMRNCRPFCLTS